MIMHHRICHCKTNNYKKGHNRTIKNQFKTHFYIICYIQCDAIRWEQFANWHFSKGYNFWTDDLILILKSLTRPYLCIAIIIICSETCLNVWILSCRLIKTVRFRIVPVWLHHSVYLHRTVSKEEMIFSSSFFHPTPLKNFVLTILML